MLHIKLKAKEKENAVVQSHRLEETTKVNVLLAASEKSHPSAHMAAPMSILMSTTSGLKTFVSAMTVAVELFNDSGTLVPKAKWVVSIPAS